MRTISLCCCKTHLLKSELHYKSLKKKFKWFYLLKQDDMKAWNFNGKLLQTNIWWNEILFLFLKHHIIFQSGSTLHWEYDGVFCKPQINSWMCDVTVAVSETGCISFLHSKEKSSDDRFTFHSNNCYKLNNKHVCCGHKETWRVTTNLISYLLIKYDLLKSNLIQ